jgi:hypothetical protein
MSKMSIGRYLKCAECNSRITDEKNAFTNGFSTPLCQACGLQSLLTPVEWYTMFAVQSGLNVIMLRKACSTLRPLVGNAAKSVVEFKSPNGTEYCIIREF